jgi:hypothetical protein
MYTQIERKAVSFVRLGLAVVAINCILGAVAVRAADAELMTLLADARQEFVDEQSPIVVEEPAVCPFMAALLAGEDPKSGPVTLDDVGIDSALYIPPEGVTNPMGVAQGVKPGRVAWDWDPTACSWDAQCSNGAGTWYSGNYYWQSSNLDQAKVDEMVANCLKWLTGEKTTAQAWNALFAYFNMNHGLGSNGYQNGEGITIKPNLVNCWSWASNPYAAHPDQHNRAMTSPAVILAILRQLVNVANVPQSDIYVYCDHIYADFLWNITHAEFPNVHYCDRNGEYGREDKSADASSPFLMSNGYSTKTLPTCLTDPKYLINCPTLKSHEDAAQNTGGSTDAELPTLCAKNHFGSLEPGGAGDFHPALEGTNGYAVYHILPDLMEHEKIGGKSLLLVIDGTYGGLNEWDSVPERWRMAPFNTNWPASILMSQDQCAIDSVGLDFLACEKQRQGDAYRGATDNYLHEASQITSPPSGITYDPDTNGAPTKSLGVHEHWIDPFEKKYTRNLRTGNGIELFTYEPLSGDFAPNTPQILPNFDVYFAPDTMSHGSIGQGIHYRWDIDGNGSWDQQGVDLTATASYSSASGPLDVRMLASNEWGETTLYVGTDVVDVIPPVAAAFSAWPTNGQVPLVVSFSDASANTPQYWYWNFEGQNSTQQNPTITFDSQGTYTVTLVVSNALGAAGWSDDTEQKVSYISAVPEPVGGVAAVVLLALLRRRTK